MTKCGHTYWYLIAYGTTFVFIYVFFSYPCILRHMSNDRSNRNKCPMCQDIIDHDDLKPIQRSKGFDLNVQSGSADSLVGTKMQFQLIEVQKGNISVHVANASRPLASNGSLRLTDIIPSVSDPNASFCRVLTATIDFMRQVFDDQQSHVAQYKQLCRNENQWFDAGDVEALPYLDEAESYISAARRKFEAKLLQEVANGTMVDVADQESTAKATIIVNNLSISQDGGSMSATSGAVTDVSSVFRSARSTTSTSSGASNHSSTTSYQVYQKCDGDLVYLHPLCTKCILTHYSQTASEDSSELRTLPMVLTGSIVDVETIRVTADIKHRYSILRHLPLYAVVSLIEIDLIGLVDNSVLAMFDQELHKRALRRMDKQKKQKRERKQDEDKR